MFKTLKNYVQGIRNKSINIEANLNHILGQWLSSTYKTSFSHTDFLKIAGETYNRSADLSEAINKIVTACHDLPLCVKTKDGKTSPVPEHIAEFLKNPDQDGSNWKSFVRKSFIQYFIGGEIFYLKKDFEKKVVLAKPHEVLKVDTVDGMPWVYSLSDTFFERTKLMGFEAMKGKNYKFESFYQGGIVRNEIAHFYNPNPILDNRGLSPVVTLINDIEILIKGKRWNRSVMQNEGRPSGVFFYPPNTFNAIAGQSASIGSKKVEDEIRRNFSGEENSRKALFLKGGLQFKEITYKMTDVDFIKGIKLSRDAIANCYGIPLQLFGSEASSTYNNYREAKESFNSDTCIPFYNEFLLFFSKKVIDEFFNLKGDFVLCVDRMKTEQHINRLLEKMAALEKVTSLTINEKRDLLGYEKLNLANTDMLLIPGGLTPIEELGMVEDENSHLDDEEAEGDKEDDKEEDKKEDDKKGQDKKSS